MHSGSKVYATRLKPHEDLKKAILQFAKDHSIKAGVIITCVGSLEQYNLRFANKKKGSKLKGFFEIVSLTGTFSESSSHLHISIADGSGQAIGGHLLEENLVYTTAELVLAELTDLYFERIMDPAYGFYELNIKERNETKR